MSMCSDCAGCEDCRKPNPPSRHPHTVTRDVTICGLELTVKATITPGGPATWGYDGGSPAEGPEVEYTSATMKVGGEVVEFDINDYLSVVNEKEAGRIDALFLGE